MKTAESKTLGDTQVARVSAHFRVQKDLVDKNAATKVADFIDGIIPASEEMQAYLHTNCQMALTPTHLCMASARAMKHLPMRLHGNRPSSYRSQAPWFSQINNDNHAPFLF